MTSAEQHAIHAEAWDRLVRKLRELDRDQSVYITMDHARRLVSAIEWQDEDWARGNSR